MRLVFAGTPEVALPALDRLVESDHAVVAVISRPDAPSGRGRALAASPISLRARELGLPLLQPTTTTDPEFAEDLRALEPDCCPIVAFGGLIPPGLLSVPSYGWINLHFSLLPAWRGAAPVQHALLHGDTVTGASTFLLDAGLDTGPVFGSLVEEIYERDTSGDLLRRLSVNGAELLAQTLDGIAAGRVGPVPQAVEGVSLAPKLTSSDARVDWRHPALHIDRLVRACTPTPGAWTTFRDERLRLFPVELERAETSLAPGDLQVDKRQVLVGTGSQAVRLGSVQPVGRKAMPATDWARGVRDLAGDQLT